MRHLDLFSGIGGFALAAQWAGYETVQFVEIEPFCHKVLKKHWPEVPIYGDIKTFNGKQYAGTIDLLTGGFPCQPYSTAGLRKGEADDRALWPEMLRVIAETRSKWVVGENVAGSIMEIDKWKSSLERIGYEVQVFDIPASACGLQTMERHIWIVAKVVGVRLEGGEKIQDKDIRKEGEFSGNDKRVCRRWNISETKFCRVVERVSDRMERHQRDRLKALGNAIVPQVAYEIIKAIREAS